MKKGLKFTIKGCFYGSQLFVMCLMVALVCYFMYTYSSDNSYRVLQLIYHQDSQASANSNEINILTQTNIKIDVDTLSKLGKVDKESNQKSDLNKTKFSDHQDSDQQILKKPSDKPKENQGIKPRDIKGLTENKNQNQDNNQNQGNNQIQDNNQNQHNNQLQKANKKPDQTIHKASYPGINATHVKQILMEPVSATYTRNIYFTVKTTYRYYSSRLFPLLVTWLQVVDKNKVSIISDRSPSSQGCVDVLREAGFDIIDTGCGFAHSWVDLSCKLGTEFGAYYNAIDKHPGKEDDYQWYCHVDDDTYVNVPQLSKFLQQYDPHKPFYFGRWPSKQRGGEVIVVLSNHTAYHMSHEANHTLKQMAFRYATGAIFCISYAIMMEAKSFFNGSKTYQETYTLAHLPDDMTVGLTIGILLGYNLTEVDDMKNQFDSISSASLKDLNKYLSVSYSIRYAKSLNDFGSSLSIPERGNPKWAFLLYHCFLYPTVSWCRHTTR